MTTCACGQPAVARQLCHTHYQAHRNKQVAYGRWQPLTTTPAAPIRAHIAALREAGISQERLAHLAKIDRSTVQNIEYSRYRTVTNTTAQRILDVEPSLADNAKIDVTGTRRRLQALIAAGWTQQALADRLGWHVSRVGHLIHDHRRYPRIHYATHKKVAALFAELQLVPGGSIRARNIGRRYRWALPLQWDEDSIDQPDAKPVRDVWTEASTRRELAEQRANRHQLVADLTRRGYNADEIAGRLGITARTVVRHRKAS